MCFFRLQQVDVSHAPAPPCLPGSLQEKLSNYCLLQSKGLAVAPSLSFSLLPRQCCTVIDKVDKEMLGHAPDRLDLKSLRWGTAASQTAYTKSPDNQQLTEKKKFGSSAEAGKECNFRQICLLWFVLFTMLLSDKCL